MVFYDVLLMSRSCPLAKLRTALGFHTIANGEHHIKTIGLDGPFYLPATLNLNCRNYCDSSKSFM